MRHLSVSERICIVKAFYKLEENASETARFFNRDRCQRRQIYPSTVIYLVKKFEATGTLLDSKRSGRPRTATDEVNSTMVAETVSTDSKTTIAQLAKKRSLSKSSVRRILKEKKFRMFKEKRLQLLKPSDYDERVRFCNWFLQHGDVELTMFSDEAVFYLNGSLKRHHWSITNPHAYTADRTQDRTKVIVWAGILNTKIIGPYFFEGSINGMSLLYHSCYL